MKINKVDRVMKVYNNMEFDRIRKNKDQMGKDSIDFSDKAREYQFALDKVKKLPEIRKDKIESLKKDVQAGIYNVEGKKIAEKMLENLELDKKK